MELRTTFTIAPSGKKITHDDPVMFIGSCFATAIGRKFEEGRMPVLINPSGTVYNPVSVCNTLDAIIDGRTYELRDLFCYNGTWLSFNHYTNFSSDDPAIVLDRINRSIDEAHKFIASARYLFVTFGTARVYRLNENGKIVSNCHKIPASHFTNELLTPGEIIKLWESRLDILFSRYPELTIVFTISPVRHWKDGAHANQVSKSVLFLAMEELISHYPRTGYFPAYELLMDDLRDYRFYEKDMLHPSQAAVDYIWDAFTDCYFSAKTKGLWREVERITSAISHVVKNDRSSEAIKFAENMLSKIGSVSSKIPSVDFYKETEYFKTILK